MQIQRQIRLREIRAQIEKADESIYVKTDRLGMPMRSYQADDHDVTLMLDIGGPLDLESKKNRLLESHVAVPYIYQVLMNK